jgi:hypothetical protein
MNDRQNIFKMERHPNQRAMAWLCRLPCQLGFMGLPLRILRSGELLDIERGLVFEHVVDGHRELMRQQ